MKAGWVEKPLGEVCDILDRLRKPITKSDRQAGPYPYYGATGVLDYIAGYLFDEPLVLIGEDGAKWEAGANSAFPVSGKVWVNNHAHVIRPHRSEVSDDWLIYFLNASDLMPFVSGMTVPKLNQGRLREIPIPVPPLEEQQRIVAVLDEAFEGLTRARAHAEANLQSARELFELRRARIFSAEAEGEAAYLEDVCLGFEYGTAAKSLPKGRVPVLRMGNLQDGEIDWTDLVYSDDTDDCARYLLKPGDVLFNRTNSAAHVGKTAIFDGKMPAIFAGYLIRVTPDPMKLIPSFLNHFLNSDVAREYGRSVMGTSVNQANISGGRLKRYTIRVPSIARQQELSDELDTLKEAVKPLQSNYRAQLKSLNALRQSLLHKAFAGELT